MKPRQARYVLRPDEEREAYSWWLDRRTAAWSVALAESRIDGDRRDAELMLAAQRRRPLGMLYSCEIWGGPRFLSDPFGAYPGGFLVRGRPAAMKPRLNRAPLTEEDRNIWLWVAYRFYLRHGSKFLATTFYTGYGERDAELMFQAQRARSYTFPVCLPPLELLSSSLEVLPWGGALDEWKTLNITYCA
jgi:hypothetical protein